MTEGIAAFGEGAGNGAFDFLRDAVAKALSSPGARSALSSCEDFTAFERGVQSALRAGASSGASALLTELDAERERPRCGECGGPMVRRSRPLTALWLLGRLRVERGYWTCGCAEGGRCPLDAEPGVRGRAGTRATPGLLRAAAPLAAETSFERAAALASRLLGFDLNAKWMERAAKRLGSAMASEDGAEALAAGAEAMCCGIDGTGVPVRPGELSAGEGKDGGQARTREAKVVVFRAVDGEAADRPTRCSAAIDSAAARDTDAKPSRFAARLWQEAQCAGFAAARVEVVLGDGAKWIWNVASELFPDAVEIVDLWHAQEHLREVGRAVHGAGTALCGAWSKKTCAALSEGRLDDVLAALRKHADNDEARRCAGHAETNRARMAARRFARPACRWVRAWWKAPAARWPDASSAAACAGASRAARTPSRRCVAGGWTDATTRTSRNRSRPPPTAIAA